MSGIFEWKRFRELSLAFFQEIPTYLRARTLVWAGSFSRLYSLFILFCFNLKTALFFTISHLPKKNAFFHFLPFFFTEFPKNSSHIILSTRISTAANFTLEFSTISKIQYLYDCFFLFLYEYSYISLDQKVGSKSAQEFF